MTSHAHEILLGFEVATGEPLYVPYAHTVVCGQTQASGKTTSLEGMISRAEGRVALAFATKQAEGAFANTRRIPPFFRDRADWQFVESILEAMMQERMKYERQWIIRVCKGAGSLEEVAANAERALHGDGKHAKAASGYAAGMYLQLSEYFKLILPELKRLKVRMSRESAELDLAPGLNVMDLTEYSLEMQSLCIASSFERVYKMRGVISVIPEAWEFIPQGKNTPVKIAAVSLVRKGLGAGNLMWLDSQDIAGVDKPLLKQVGVWILGVQREINEVEHTLAQMALPKKAKPKPEDVMQLRRGQFYVSFNDVMKHVYVLPAWMPQRQRSRSRSISPARAANRCCGKRWTSISRQKFGGRKRTWTTSGLRTGPAGDRATETALGRARSEEQTRLHNTRQSNFCIKRADGHRQR